MFDMKICNVKKQMRVFLMVACFMAAMPVFQSCQDGDGYSLGDFTPPLLATIRTTSGAGFYLDCDVWGTCWPVNTDMSWYLPIDGQRVVVVFNPLWDNYAGYDHAVKILDMQEVLTKNVKEMTAESEPGYGNDPLPLSKEDITISNGYMNVSFLTRLPMGVEVELVRSLDTTDDGYIRLELRGKEDSGIQAAGTYSMVSYNLESLNATTDTKGIILKINTLAEGETEVTFDITVS